MDLRGLHDPDLEVRDGVLDEFPRNCVGPKADPLLMKLPYGMGLRGVVRFPLLNAIRP
jgi:hypothetical protein